MVSRLPLKGAQPQSFRSVHVYCGQMAGWMKTPLGTEVDLGPGHTALAPRERGTASPLFSARVYCSHDRPSQLLLRPCICNYMWIVDVSIDLSWQYCNAFKMLLFPG